MLGINLYLEMVRYAFCRRHPVQEGNGDGDGQCEFDGEKKKFGGFFFLVYRRLVGIVDPQWHFDSTLANRLAL